MLSSERIPERTSEMAQETKEGRSSPLGATLSLEGANFSVYSKHATGIKLLLFDGVDDAGSTLSLRGLDNSTYYILDQDRARYADFSGAGNTEMKREGTKETNRVHCLARYGGR